MSYNDAYWGGRGNCPKCGRFVCQIKGLVRAGVLEGVTGVCSTHGKVDLSHQDWGYEDFLADQEDGSDRANPNH